MAAEWHDLSYRDFGISHCFPTGMISWASDLMALLRLVLACGWSFVDRMVIWLSHVIGLWPVLLLIWRYDAHPECFIQTATSHKDAIMVKRTVWNTVSGCVWERSRDRWRQTLRETGTWDLMHLMIRSRLFLSRTHKDPVFGLWTTEYFYSLKNCSQGHFSCMYKISFPQVHTDVQSDEPPI